VALEWGRKDEFVQAMFRKSHSVHSRRFYEVALRKFGQFCDEKKVSEVNDQNVYDVLNRFVEWNDARGIRSKTITGYLSGTKRFLLYQDIEIDENRYRNKVSIPRVTKIDDQPLTIPVIRSLLSFGLPNKKMLALILTLLSSGMRLAEALNLRVSDLELDSTPVRVHIKAEYSKTKRNRVGFISDEAKEAIKDILYDLAPIAQEGGENRKHVARPKVAAPPGRYVFDYTGDIWQREKLAILNFVRVRERAGLSEKFEDYQSTFHKVHFHLFRKFFLTKGSDVIGEHAAHALIGHSFYMDTYYRKSDEERRADYLKLMPYLTVLSSHPAEMEDVDEKIKRQMLRAVGYSQEEMARLKVSELDDETVQRLIKEKLFATVMNNGQRQKLVPSGEVDRWMGEGWEWIGNLPDGRSVLRLPS
jgi:integrase